ncbi:Potassium transport protein [Madurella fahalii]|uniref:Potassium transport protein n=1 Tax=Madurella fahalii TaxID=1157608 RepID=A0ABQ0G609_9PEZI
MWKPRLNFITLHYAYIITLSLLGLLILYPYGNLSAVDAYFFGASSSTESGLNTVDVKDLKLYQQLYIYFTPIIANLGFVNIIVVVVRIYWFEKRLKRLTPPPPRTDPETIDLPGRENDPKVRHYEDSNRRQATPPPATTGDSSPDDTGESQHGVLAGNEVLVRTTSTAKPGDRSDAGPARTTSISFAPDPPGPRNDSRVLYIPSPRERDTGHPILELDTASNDDNDGEPAKPLDADASTGLTHRRSHLGESSTLVTASVDRMATSMFIIGPSRTRSADKSSPPPRHADLPYLSKHATVGRNSAFHNLTARDREQLGGIEYRSLKLLLKIVIGYFFGLHLFGVICLVPWIQHADRKYTDYLDEMGLNKIWWAFYSAQTMVDNLGFALTPDSMARFKDATWPMLVMTFLAFAGNTCYPIFLRLVIWTMSRLVPSSSSIREPLRFLLDHPRRCYTLLFPSRPTWILFGILFALNFVDVLLIVVLDLDNPAVNDLPMGPRILSALFQAASSRHTGTSTLNLAAVSPGVQFSLLVMMYISVYPIAISIRASNTYEERSLGIYYGDVDANANEHNARSYILAHMQNQLSFDLWYMFLGIFCICVAEADRIADVNEPAFAIFPIFFEVVSAYGNVGLSIGHPAVLTSLCGQFTTFSKLVICAMMIRGRHRGMPYALDRAIILPDVDVAGESSEERDRSQGVRAVLKLKHAHTA